MYRINWPRVLMQATIVMLTVPVWSVWLLHDLVRNER